MKTIQSLSLLIFSVLFSTGCVAKGVYRQLVQKPDAPYREINSTGSVLDEKKAFRGLYIGITNSNGRTYHIYHFKDFFVGTNRQIEICLSTSDDTGNARDISGQTPTKTGQPSTLFLNYHPGYDREAAILYLRGSEATNRCLMGFIWEKESQLCLNPVIDDGVKQEWYCDIIFRRVIRSRTMAFIRPIYGIPISILCLPVDVVGIIWTGVYGLCNSRAAIECGWYPNLAEQLNYD